MTLRHIDLAALWVTGGGVATLTGRVLLLEPHSTGWWAVGVAGLAAALVGFAGRALVAGTAWSRMRRVALDPPAGWQVWVQGPYGRGPHRDQWEGWVQAPNGARWRAVAAPLWSRIAARSEPTLWESPEEALAAANRELARNEALVGTRQGASGRAPGRVVDPGTEGYGR